MKNKITHGPAQFGRSMTMLDNAGLSHKIKTGIPRALGWAASVLSAGKVGVVKTAFIRGGFAKGLTQLGKKFLQKTLDKSAHTVINKVSGNLP